VRDAQRPQDDAEGIDVHHLGQAPLRQQLGGMCVTCAAGNAIRVFKSLYAFCCVNTAFCLLAHLQNKGTTAEPEGCRPSLAGVAGRPMPSSKGGNVHCKCISEGPRYLQPVHRLCTLHAEAACMSLPDAVSQSVETDSR